MNFFID